MRAQGYGYTVEVPEGWWTQPRAASATGAARKADLMLRRPADDPDFKSRISTTYEVLGQDVPYSELENLVKRNAIEMTRQPGATVFAMLPATFDGVKGFGFEFQMVLEGQLLEMRQLTVVQHRIAYFVQLSCPEGLLRDPSGEPSANLLAFRDAVDSWRWTPLP